MNKTISIILSITQILSLFTIGYLYQQNRALEQKVAVLGNVQAQPSGIPAAPDRPNLGNPQAGITAGAVPSPEPQPNAKDGCMIGGCSGQLCAEAPKNPDEGLVSTCEFKEEYACYQTAICEKQADGKCGWTQTNELKSCISRAQSSAAGAMTAQ